MTLKENILYLREQGWTYNKIADQLNCSKGTITYHCSSLKTNTKIIQDNLKQIHFLKHAHCKWGLEQKDQVKQLYQMTVPMSEIADATFLPLEEIIAFCSTLQQIDISKLSNYEKVKLRRKKLKILAVISKGGRCENCGYCQCWSAFEFHHLDPTKKDFALSQKVNTSWKSIKKAITKCQLLCANCHREAHDDNFLDNLLLSNKLG